MRVRFTPGSLEGIKFDGTPQGYEGANGLEHKGAWPHYRGVIPGYFNDEVVNVVTADGQVELFVEFATFEERRKPLLVGLKVEESPDLGAVAALAEYDNPNHRNMAKIRTHFFDRVAAEPVLPPGQELPEVAQKLQECVDRARSAVRAPAGFSSAATGTAGSSWLIIRSSVACSRSTFASRRSAALAATGAWRGVCGTGGARSGIESPRAEPKPSRTRKRRPERSGACILRMRTQSE